MSKKLTQFKLLMLWLPLVATWALMGLEMPAVHIAIAHLPNLKENLAAVGVAMSIFVVLESPIFSMLSASTVLVTDSQAYYKMRNFTVLFGGLLTSAVLLALSPSIFNFITVDWMKLPSEIQALVWWALLILFPCPLAVGYRRLYQGILVRAGLTSMVGLGTFIRVFITIGTMLLLAWLDFAGVFVGIGAITAGMLSEALISRIIVQKTLVELCKTSPKEGSQPLTYGYISKFYMPLALNGIIATAINPILVFFMSGDINSLAVFPVACGIANFFISTGLGLHDLILANLGENNINQPELRKFATLVIGVVAGILIAILFTPLSDLLYARIYGLTPQLIEFIKPVSGFIVLHVVLLAIMFWERAILLDARKTLIVTIASVADLIAVFVSMFLLCRYSSYTGVFKAEFALTVGIPAIILMMYPTYHRRMKFVKGQRATLEFNNPVKTQVA